MLETFSRSILTPVVLRRTLPAALVAAAALLAASCMKTGTGGAISHTNANTANANAANANASGSSSSFDSGKYEELMAKVKELEDSSLPVKLDPKAAIKGKVFFDESLEARSRHADYDRYIPDDRKARNLEELGTVVRITAPRVNFSATTLVPAGVPPRVSRDFVPFCQLTNIVFEPFTERAHS